MMIDNPSPIRPSMDSVQPGGLSVPSFHYPQRQKVFPLAAVPDANRVASPPRTTKGHLKSGSFCFGTPQQVGVGERNDGRDSALGMGMVGVEGEGKENGNREVY